MRINTSNNIKNQKLPTLEALKLHISFALFSNRRIEMSCFFLHNMKCLRKTKNKKASCGNKHEKIITLIFRVVNRKTQKEISDFEYTEAGSRTKLMLNGKQTIVFCYALSPAWRARFDIICGGGNRDISNGGIASLARTMR